MLCGAGFAGSFKPFYDHFQTEEGSFFAVRPFYSHTTVKEGEIRDFIWPLYSRKSFLDEETSRAFLFYFTHQFNADEENPRYRRWLFPFYFQGRDAQGKTYSACVPLGGTLREFLGRDKISFLLFPLLGKSQINDVKTTSVFWPIYSRTRGSGIQRDRVFPLVGKSMLEGKYEKRFVLWPFWTSADYFYPGNEGRSWVLFPLCGRTKTKIEETLWVAPPLFRFTRGEKENRIFCPWPFFQKIDSERRNKLYVWPLWGRTQLADGQSHRSFLLWPLLWSERAEQDCLLKTRKMAFPFFFLERGFSAEENLPEEKPTEVSRYWKVWPLMSWQRDEHASRFQMLELWPVKNSAPVERNWAPLWRLYKRTNTDGLIQKDVFWFVWHSEREAAANRAEWSLLKGLLSYKKEEGRRGVRLLYGLKFGK